MSDPIANYEKPAVASALLYLDGLEYSIQPAYFDYILKELESCGRAGYELIQKLKASPRLSTGEYVPQPHLIRKALEKADGLHPYCTF